MPKYTASRDHRICRADGGRAPRRHCRAEGARRRTGGWVRLGNSEVSARDDINQDEADALRRIEEAKNAIVL